MSTHTRQFSNTLLPSRTRSSSSAIWTYIPESLDETPEITYLATCDITFRSYCYTQFSDFYFFDLGFWWISRDGVEERIV